MGRDSRSRSARRYSRGFDNDCKVLGLGFRFEGFGFRASGLGFKLRGLGFRVSSSGLRVYERLRFMV